MPVAMGTSQTLLPNPEPEAARRRLVRLRREQRVVRHQMKSALLAQQNTLPPARDPLGP